jgi:Holliday junction resolvase
MTGTPSLDLGLDKPPGRKRVSDHELIAAYRKTGSVWKAGELVGIGGQSVHERLVKLGAVNRMNYFTDEENDRLRREYQANADAGTLETLAREMGRTKHFICRQARALGLTDKARKRPYIATWKYLDETTATGIWEDFKKSRLGLGKYCTKKGYDDLGFSKRMRELFADEWDHVIELKASKQTMYRYGRAFEYRVRDHLRKLGYFVTRAPASRSPVDLTAVKTGTVALVQCKTGGALRPVEWNALFDLAVSVGAVPVLASSPMGRGIIYHRLTDRKDGTARAQPLIAWEPNQ